LFLFNLIQGLIKQIIETEYDFKIL
jgi:hypothetical protein